MVYTYSDDLNTYNKALSILESTTDIAIETGSIMISKAAFMVESVTSLYDMNKMDDTEFYESENVNNKVAKSGLGKIIDAIIDFFKRAGELIKETISNLFNGSKAFESEEFLNSEEYNLMLNYNYNEKISELNKEIENGRSLVGKLISNNTNLDSKTVDVYEARANTVVKSTPKIIALGVGIVAGIKGFRFLARNYKDAIKVFTGDKTISQVIDERKIKKQLETITDTDKISAISRVLKSIKSLGGKANEIKMGVLSNIKKVTNKFDKKHQTDGV